MTTCSAMAFSSWTQVSARAPVLQPCGHTSRKSSKETIDSRCALSSLRRGGFRSEFFVSPASKGTRRGCTLRLGCRGWLLNTGSSNSLMRSFAERCGKSRLSNSRRCGRSESPKKGSKRMPFRRNALLYDEAGGTQLGGKHRYLFGKLGSKSVRLRGRRKLRCWEHEDVYEDRAVRETAAIASIEQAIKFQAEEETRLFFGGPTKGDLAEVEAYCRLYRLAEQLSSTVMTALRSISSNFENVGSETPGGEYSSLDVKVASSLAHLMAVIHEGRAEVFGLSARNEGAASAAPDELPPLARLRKEARARCGTLQTALDSLIPNGTEESAAIRERRLKFVNACLDAGFPRPEGIPNAADIPNLAPVRLGPLKGGTTLYKDENVAFWRGGHMTPEGLAWLVEKGFKLIVDLREDSSETIVQSDSPDSGKLKVIRMPVENRGSPSKEQVEEFARLVADEENRPLYLLTRAGVSRASAMVSKWRELILRSQLRSEFETVDDSRAPLESAIELPHGDDVVKISQEDVQTLMTVLDSISADDHLETLGSSAGDDSRGEDVHIDEDVNSMNGNGAIPPPDVEVTENDELSERKKSNGSAQNHDRSIDVTKNAFEAQRPVRNVLNRKEMSKFMKGRNIPKIFLTSRITRKNGNFASPSHIADSLVNAIIAGPTNRWGLSAPSFSTNEVKEREQRESTIMEGKKGAKNGFSGIGTNGSSIILNSEDPNHTGSQAAAGLETENSERESKVSASNGIPRVQASDASAATSDAAEERNETPDSRRQSSTNEEQSLEDDDDATNVEGDMCASTTGVVRVQSRKKAEMFLVRTDGYSCTRERVKESTLAFSHPSTQQQMLMWKTPPRTALLLKKLGSELTNETQEVASFLHYQEGMNVLVEPDVHDLLARLPGFGFIQTFYSQDTSELHERVDLVVCLGGDGVILHASNLFRNAVPPIVSFNLGSLGFLTTHTFPTYKQDLRAVIHGNVDMMTGVYITLRMRLRCQLYRGGKAVPGKVFDVLNEVVVDRGSNPYLSKIECYERNHLITKVQADGVIIATPTGSTAYSIAAGGSMVHPNVPCMLFTPICPHSLSFRPVILPDSALLELKVPDDARNNAWVSFDGKRRQQLSRGDSVRITMSEHPLPTVNKSDQTDDWFRSLVRCLNWNDRLEQRPLTK